MARPRRRHEIRWSVWTFVAPVALVVAAILVVSVVRGAIEDAGEPASSTGTTAAASTGKTAADAGASTAAAVKKRVYTVREGETLSDIAARFDTTVAAIQELNPELDPDAIQPGQRIRVS